MDICFEGIGQTAATFEAEGGLEPGTAVTLTSEGRAAAGKAGEQLCGVALGRTRGGSAAVQIGGAAQVRCTGAAPKPGWRELACDGAGGVKAVESGGIKRLVLAVDEDGKSIVVKL